MKESALILGFIGSLHCAAMCGPLMLGLSAKNYSWFAFIVHHIGRWLGYIILSSLFYLVVAPLYIFELQQYVALITGILLIAYGLKKYIGPVGRMLERFSQFVARSMSSGRIGRTGNIGLGILNGLLPCGLSFGVAIFSVTEGSLTNAAWYMVQFGLGTLPMLLAISYLPRLGGKTWLNRLNSWIPTMLVIAGFLLIVRSAGLGIPYLSPDYNAETQTAECCEPIH